MVRCGGFYGDREIGMKKRKAEERDILHGAADLQAACESLKDHVNNRNQSSLILTGNVYREDDPGKFYSITVGGVEIGFRRTAFATFIRREVAIRVAGHRFADLSDEQKDEITIPALNTFIIPGAGPVRYGRPKNRLDTLILRQDFIPDVPVERSPRLRSIAGGLG